MNETTTLDFAQNGQRDAVAGEILEARYVTKTPGTRLLDLLAGWSHFVDRDETSDDEQAGLIDAALSAEELAAMYQEAGAEVYELSGDAEAEAVRRWVLEKILPALLRATGADTVKIAA